MAVTWKNFAKEDNAILKALLTAAGDIIYASGASTPARLAKGSNGEVLTLAAGLPSWAAAAAGATLTVAETEVFNGTSPTAWTDLDLSGTIGSNVALVLLKVENPYGSSYSFAFRKNGDTDEQYLASSNAGVARGYWGSAVFAVFWVAADSGGKVEWKVSDAKADIIVDIVAYIK